jgi:hypothetical protein
MKYSLAIVALAVPIAGCVGGLGEATDDDANLPSCSEVWVDEEELPSDYEGCIGEDEEAVRADPRQCGRGRDRYVTYAFVSDGITYPFIGVLGKKIVAYSDVENHPYAELYRKCGM